MKMLAIVAMMLGIAVVAIQTVPYGRNHVNPPRRAEPAWDTPTTRHLAVRACYNCHSNETVWPWYAGFAPASWLIQRDVDEGRRKLNFSEWDRPQKEVRESAKAVRKGEMPPWYYVAAWSEARLTSAERDALVRGLQATVGAKGRAGKR
jgi:mono/diheme cytochrome c family protein